MFNYTRRFIAHNNHMPNYTISKNVALNINYLCLCKRR